MSTPSNKPVLDRKAAEQMNLNVLRRLDADVEELLATAAHVALYDFDVSTTQWSRKDVEGSLFVVKRRGLPRFRFVILNKKSANNFMEDVGGGFQCEVKEPYLLYKSKGGGVVGIWFYEEEDCRRIARLLQKIASTFSAPKDETLQTAASQGQQDASLMSPQSRQYAQQGQGMSRSGVQNAPQYSKKGEPLHHHNAPATVVARSQGDDDDGVFWDRRVKVPKDVPAPGALTASIAAQPSEAAENVLSRVFASMKVANGATVSGTDAGVEASASKGFASSSTTGAMLASAPSTGQLPVPSQIPLLTPQFLQQQQYKGSGSLKSQNVEYHHGAVSSGDVTKSDDSGTEKGAALLRSLQSSSKGFESEVPATKQMERESHFGVSLPENARKVSALMQALAANESFCRQLATEMERVGLF